MSGGLLDGGEDSCGLDNVGDIHGLPLNGSGISLAKDRYLLAVDDQLIPIDANVSLVAPVGGVVLEHIDHVVERDEGIVDGGDFDIGCQRGTKDQATDAAKAVDTDFGSHLEKESGG